MRWINKNKGFTIVELLIVVVVIAILAAITIVAYNGIQNRAKNSAVVSSLESVAKNLETYRYTKGGSAELYPTTLAQASISNGATAVGYYPANGNQYFCIDAKNGAIAYYQTSIDSIQRQGQCPSATGLTHWWPFNGDATDYALGTNTSTTYGATPTTGQNGKANTAYSFADNGNSYIDTNLSEDRSAFSFSIWVKPTIVGSYRTPLSETRDCCGSGYKGMQLVTSYSNTDSASASIWNGGNGSAAYIGGSTAAVGTWSHFVGTYNGSTMKFFKDGALVGTADYTATIGNNVDTLKFGRAGAQAAGWYYGAIDDVRIYNRALNDSEITNIFTLGAQ